MYTTDYSSWYKLKSHNNGMTKLKFVTDPQTTIHLNFFKKIDQGKVDYKNHSNFCKLSKVKAKNYASDSYKCRLKKSNDLKNMPPPYMVFLLYYFPINLELG
jgi:hypothetical protein